MNFTVIFKKDKLQLQMRPDETVEGLKARLEALSGLPKSSQKLLFKGKALMPMLKTLRQAGIEADSKVLLIGTAHDQIKEVLNPPRAPNTLLNVERRQGNAPPPPRNQNQGWTVKH